MREDDEDKHAMTTWDADHHQESITRGALKSDEASRADRGPQADGVHSVDLGGVGHFQ